MYAIRAYNEAMKRGKHGGNEETGDGVKGFNAAAYWFVSCKLAVLFPGLEESQIIQRFSTVWPKQSYKHRNEVSKSYSSRFSSVTRAAAMVQAL